MPEIKHNFTGSKMNKDVDERLVPNGEYRDAMNIQVSTSEGSDVGTVQNILGNAPGCSYPYTNSLNNILYSANPIPFGAKTVGSVSDEKNDSLYWLIAHPELSPNLLSAIPPPTTPLYIKDMIMRKTPGGCEPVFVDLYGVLFTNTDDNTPTGNIIESTNTNTLTLNNVSWFNSLHVGMTVTGLTAAGIPTAISPVITSIGALNTINTVFSPTYFQNSTPIGTLDQSNSSGVEFHVDCNCSNSPACYYYDQDGTGLVAYHIPSNIIIIKIADNATLSAGGIQVGDMLNIKSFSGSNIVTPTVTSITYDLVNMYIEHTSPDYTTWQNYPGEWTTMPQSASPMLTPGTFGPNSTWGPLSAQTPQTCIPGLGATVFASASNGNAASVTVYRVTSTVQPYISLAPNSPWLNEIYNILFDNAGNPTGADVSIEASATWPDIGGGIGGCIDVAASYTTSPPDPNNNIFYIVDCNTGTPILPGTNNTDITFIATGGFSNQIIALSGNIGLDAGSYPYLYFQGDRVLNFKQNQLITGINILDDMLIWTDNLTEPKKINIPRSIEGTHPNGNTHTRLVNDALNISPSTIDVPIKEEHITVIRKSPKTALTLDLETTRDPELNHSGIMKIDDGVGTNESSFTYTSANLIDFSSLNVGDTFFTEIESDMSGNTSFSLSWTVGTKVVLMEFDDTSGAPQIPITEYRIKGEITNWGGANNFDNTSGGVVQVAILITAIEGFPPAVSSPNLELKYAIDLFDETKKMFEFKFPRFSYRYKYEDGEYSTFAPFTEVAFIPGNFIYHPNQGYNLGMTNRINSIVLKDFVTQDIPKDVIEIDLLYKEDVSPNIYIVDTIKPKATIEIGAAFNKWNSNTYEITSETIHSVVAENQLLRPWDNVPRKALAQEVTGNRIVYGNYLQNYNLIVGGDDFYPEFKHAIDSQTGATLKSIKSLRDYQLGVVFIDKYGRETPVISNPTATFKIEKSKSNSKNELRAGFHGGSSGTGIPIDFKYYKFFIKETSGEYYNMAMDRYWDAEDGNIWLSFPSSDRNKIDIDTFLILKKGVETDDLVKDPARYKVIAIENEAPDFIKTKKTLISAKVYNPSGDDIFNGAIIPSENSRDFTLSYPMALGGYENSSIYKLHENPGNGILYFQLQNSNASLSSKRYKISAIGAGTMTTTGTTPIPNHWEITLDKPFGADINAFTNDPSGTNSTTIISGTRVIFYRDTVENSPEFDGRFFVKIYNDSVFTKWIVNPSTGTEVVWNTVSSKKIFNFNKAAHHWVYNNTNPFDNGNSIPPGQISHNDFSQPGSSTPSDNWKQYCLATNYTGDAENGPFSFTDPDRSYYGNTASWQGKLGADWQPYDAFFRGLNITRGSWRHDKPWHNGRDSRVSPHLPHANLPGAWDFQDVWFVDDDTDAGRYSYGFNDGQGFGKIADHQNNVSYGIYTNAQGEFKMNLGFGGVQAPQWGQWAQAKDQPHEPYVPNQPIMFDLLNRAMYSTENSFIKGIEGNIKFRWKEDPTETIYTIENTSGFLKIRYENMGKGQYATFDSWANAGTVHSHIDLVNQWQHAFGYHTTLDWWWNEYISSGWQQSTEDVYFTSTYYRPSNYTRNWILKLDKDMSANWNPYTPNGKIVGGLSVSVIAGGSVNNGNEIPLTSIIGTDAAYPGPQTVQEGMVLESINGVAIATTNLAAVAGFDFTQLPNAVLMKKYITDDPTVNFSIQDNTGNTISNGDILVFSQYGFNGVSPNSVKNINFFQNAEGFGLGAVGIGAVGYTLEIIEPAIIEQEMPTNPAIWETEPKDSTDLDIYYEISGSNPIMLDSSTIKTVFPLGSKVKSTNGGGSSDLSIVNNTSMSGNTITLSEPLCVQVGGCTDTGVLIQPVLSGDYFTITRLDGTQLTIEVQQSLNPSLGLSNTFKISTFIYNSWYTLNWHNCYSFGNGVESNRIRDNFNLPFILNGVKASTTVDNLYEEEHRKYGLIYSGIYNSNSGVNNLNQFIQAEKITKDVNPIYGSIQKLHSRSTADGDLIALCEDRILKILANKDALYNADGNVQLTSTNNVLGQTIPFSGDFGISKNPESFASESYRVYFTDKVRGTIMRLSKDGLTPISDHGMKDWFRDNLKLSTKLIGSYDDKKDEYNITLDFETVTSVSTHPISIIGTDPTGTGGGGGGGGGYSGGA